MYESNVENYEKRSGKVRDLYSLGDTMLVIVTTDRVSAFDYVFPNTIIPDKGKILQALTLHWGDVLGFKDHVISTEPNHLPNEFRGEEFNGRVMLVEKAEPVPFECVVRGYLCGSAWKEYVKTGQVAGMKLPTGLKQNQQFPKPLFTPARKIEDGHDENVSFETFSSEIGPEVAIEIEAMSIELYMDAAQSAWSNGIIIADTKFEWGFIPHMENELILIDEILTPDNSRFWALSEYKLGSPMNSFDKDFLRNWLIDEITWENEGFKIPEHVLMQTRDKYVEAYERITGKQWT
jgi:phosphoribosylaminoimidazole-succinocarboxamide synthase